MRISDWSSDVCSSDLSGGAHQGQIRERQQAGTCRRVQILDYRSLVPSAFYRPMPSIRHQALPLHADAPSNRHYPCPGQLRPDRSEEHTSELQSLLRISYAVFCLKKKQTTKNNK